MVHIFKVFIILALISPLLFIMSTSAESIANSTIFLSYSSSIRSGLWRPSVSSKSSHLTPFISSGNCWRVKYIPTVHLPVPVLNYVPKAEFIRVDFPDDCGPITHTTTTLSFFEFSITSLIKRPLNSRFSPSINSKQSPFLS